MTPTDPPMPAIDYAPDPPAPRPLSSLTEEEARECYRLAFGEIPSSNYAYFKCIPGAQIEDISVQDPFRFWLNIHQSGRMAASCEVSSEFAEFNAVAVVRYLDSLGIALG